MGYKIWDKVSPIYTPGHDSKGKSKFTPAEMLAKYSWAEVSPVFIGDGPINGSCFMEYHQTLAVYKGMGFTPSNPDNPDLTAHELSEWEVSNNAAQQQAAQEQAAVDLAVKNSAIAANEAQSTAAAAQERQAAALEFQSMMLM